jgi:tripartite-type tricarboxylate transporter receptor subunit TctC
MRTHRVQIALVCVVAAVGLAAGDLAAQPYPAKSVRVVIPAAPGSNTDVFFRIVAQKMGSILGQQLVADYRPGAGGTIGANMVAKSTADGYTIAIVAAGFVMNPAMYKKMPYDVSIRSD